MLDLERLERQLDHAIEEITAEELKAWLFMQRIKEYYSCSEECILNEFEDFQKESSFNVQECRIVVQNKRPNTKSNFEFKLVA